MKQCEKGHFYDDARFSACPYCAPAADKPAAAEAGKTVAVQPAPAPAEAGKTVGILRKKVGIDPPVAFVVCSGGPQKGQYYALKAGRNFIGRGPDMDVSLPDDDTVSRENHANISYDARSNRFILAPGTGRGVAYCNGEMLTVPHAMEAYDVVEVGASRLVFLPLCGDKFTWSE